MKKTIIVLIVAGLLYSQPVFAYGTLKGLENIQTHQLPDYIRAMVDEIERNKAEITALQNEIAELKNKTNALEQIVMTFQSQIVEVLRTFLNFTKIITGR